MLDVKMKRMSLTAVEPMYAHEDDACVDLYADIQSPVIIPPHTTAKIGCGWAFQPPKGYCGLIFARSGISTKRGLRPANCVGMCDESYTGQYIVALHNDTDEEQEIRVQERIAQLMFVPYEQAKFTEVDELKETKRGTGGFGSSGRK